MAKIFSFSTIEEKLIYRSLSHKKCHKRRNDWKGRYSLAHFWENLKSSNLSRGTQKKPSFQFSVKFTKNDVFRSCDIIINFFFTFHFFWKLKKKKFIYLKTLTKFNFLGPVTSILTFFQFSQKCAIEYIDPSGHFVFYEIFFSSNF